MQSLLLGTHRASAPPDPRRTTSRPPSTPHSRLQTIIQMPDRRWPLPTASHHEPMLMSLRAPTVAEQAPAWTRDSQSQDFKDLTCSHKPARASSPQEPTFLPASHTTVFRGEARESPSCFPPTPPPGPGGSASTASSRQNVCHPASPPSQEPVCRTCS